MPTWAKLDSINTAATGSTVIPSSTTTTVLLWAVLAAAVVGGLYFLLWTLTNRYAKARTATVAPETNEQRRSRGLPLQHCIGEKRDANGNAPRQTILTIHTDREPARIEGLTTAEAEEARDWWLDPYTRATPGSALWILEGPIELPTGEQTWRTQLVSDAGSIRHMLIETKAEATEPPGASETPMPKGWQPDPHDDY